MQPRYRFAAVLLLAIVTVLSGHAASPKSAATLFTWIAVADHFEQPAKGLVERMVAAKPALVVGIGDLVFRSNPDDFTAFKTVIIAPLRRVGARFYPVAGNHDFPVRPHWFEFWDPPANRLHYSFDYGNAHFVVLDTNRAFLSEGSKTAARPFAPDSEEYAIQTQAEDFAPGSAQYEWLRRDLAGTKQTHLFVFFHQPAFSFGGHEGSPAIQRALCPLFEKYRVTAVFMGHSHGYERFVPLRVDLSSGAPVAVPDPRKGVVYIVTAGGGKPLYDITQQPTHAAIARAFHFLRVDIRGDTAYCSVIEAGTGKVLDSFALRARRPAGAGGGSGPRNSLREGRTRHGRRSAPRGPRLSLSRTRCG